MTINKKFWNTEKLLGLSAMLVSLMTLIVFTYQTNIMQEEKHMSVYPYLMIRHMYVGSPQYEYVIKNNGIGPALIDSVKVTTGNGEVYTSILNFVMEKLSNDDSVLFTFSNLPFGSLVPAREDVKLIQNLNEQLTKQYGFKISPEEKRRSLKSAQKLFNLLSNDSLLVEVTYRSIYNERWVITSKPTAPQKID